MLREMDNFYLEKTEPVKACLFALRDFILKHNPDITEAWKYKMPFFCYKGKMFCYLWTHKKNGRPYIGIVEGKKIDYPGLVSEKRSRMKIMFIDPDEDLPVNTIQKILQMAIDIYNLDHKELISS